MTRYSYPGAESTHRTVLANGITTLVYQNMTAESVVIEGILRVGALAESAEQAGLATFTAEMLMRGSERWAFEQIYEELESVGAVLSIGGNRHVSDFSGRALVEDLPLMLDLLSDCLRRPTFPKKQVEQIRGEIITSLQMRANETSQMAGLAFREVLYEGHPYGRSVDGYEDTVGQIGQEDLLAFYQHYYGPAGMIVTVVGAIEPAAAVAQLEAAFGDWQTSQEPMPDSPAAGRPETTRRVTVDMPGKSQANVVLGLPGPKRSEPDYLEASMANTVLGVFGMMGRLGQRVREEQGLAYSIYSQLHGGLGPSPWTVGTGVAPDKVELAIASILAEIDKIRKEPIPEEELADSQAYRSGLLPVSLETNDGLASVITDIELYELGSDFLQQLPRKVMAMTPESVQAAAYKYLSTEQIVIAIAGPDLDEGKGEHVK
jgi:zinc protease